MTPKKEWASLGSYPTNARTAKGIQSKAVCKYKEFRDLSFTLNPDSV
jgi:hypothetical protein